MQIYEITQKKKINEINWGATAAALGNQLRTSMARQAGIAEPTDAGTAYGDVRGRAAELNKPVIAVQAKQQAAQWNRALQQLMIRDRVNQPSQLSPLSKQTMMRSLSQQLHRNLLQGELHSDYHQLPSVVSRDANIQAEANQVVAQLESTIAGIEQTLNNNSDPSSYWASLCELAYQAMSLAQLEGSRVSKRSMAKLPKVTTVSATEYKIGNTTIDAAATAGYQDDIWYLLNQEAKTNAGMIEIEFDPGTGMYTVNGYALDPRDPVEKALIAIIQKEMTP